MSMTGMGGSGNLSNMETQAACVQGAIAPDKPKQLDECIETLDAYNRQLLDIAGTLKALDISLHGDHPEVAAQSPESDRAPGAVNNLRYSLDMYNDLLHRLRDVVSSLNTLA